MGVSYASSIAYSSNGVNDFFIFFFPVIKKWLKIRISSQARLNEDYFLNGKPR
jgi:hypothetical protein